MFYSLEVSTESVRADATYQWPLADPTSQRAKVIHVLHSSTGSLKNSTIFVEVLAYWLRDVVICSGGRCHVLNADTAGDQARPLVNVVGAQSSIAVLGDVSAFSGFYDDCR